MGQKHQAADRATEHDTEGAPTAPGARTRTDRLPPTQKRSDGERAAAALEGARRSIQNLGQLADQLADAIAGRDFFTARTAHETIARIRPGLASTLADAKRTDTDPDAVADLDQRTDAIGARLDELLPRAPVPGIGIGDILGTGEDDAERGAWLAQLDQAGAGGANATTGAAGEVPHRAELEPMFGQSFADVQATTGDRALASRGIRGAAEGSAVSFADAAPARDVVAHELTHVVQQRQAGILSTALLSESQPTDAAEVEARAIGDQVRAGDLRAVTVRAAPAAAVHFDRAADRAAGDAFEGTAPAYFGHNLGHILQVIRAQIAAADWPLAHTRVSWLKAPTAIATAITSRMVELAEAPAGPVFAAQHFPAFWHPVDLWGVVDRNRLLTSGAAGAYEDGKPSGKGPLRGNGAVDEAVALEFVAPLRASFARMVPRFIAAADDNRPEPVDAGQLVTSAPIDRLWVRVLADPAMVRHTAPTGATSEAPTPTGPGVFRGGPRPVEYEWMGSEDPRMWNVLRVTSPADATAEDVAATLYQYPGVTAVQSHNAFAIVDAAPLFVLPRTWAKDFPAAVKWATAEHASDRNEPIDAVLSSTATDEAAIAQGADEPMHKLARRGKASHADTERLAAMLWKGSEQLGYVAEALAPWKLTPPIDAARAWVQRRVAALVNETPAQIAQWAPVIEEQQHLLTEASGAVVDVLGAAQSAGITPSSSAAAPFRRTLAAYANALGTSHLVDVARERLATANAERSQLALTFAEGALSEATTATESLREAEGGSYGPESDAGELVKQRKRLQRNKLEIRAQMLDGDKLDGDKLEDLTLEAGMVTVRARSKELAKKARALSSMLGKAEDGAIASIAAGFDSRFDTLPFQLSAFADECDGLTSNMDYAGTEERLGWRAHTDEDQDTQYRAMREIRRKALARAQADLAALPVTHGLDRLNREAIDAVTDNQLRALAIDVVLLILASVATSGIAAAAGGAVRGAMLADAAVGSARFIATANRARFVAGGVELATDAVLNAGAQSAITGDGLGTATAENVLANVGVRAVLSRFAPIVGALDEEAMALWQTGGAAGKGAVVLAKGATITAELVTAAGVSYAVQRIVRGQQPPSDDELSSWVIQGASMAAGRMIASRTTQLNERLRHIATEHAYLVGRAGKQTTLATRVEAKGDPQEAMLLLIEHRALLYEEARVLRELEANPAKLAALHLSQQDRATFARGNADALNDTAAQGMDVLPLRLAGVDEIVPGALWSGTSEQIAKALDQARAVGITVEVVKSGTRGKRWRVKFGERALDIEERATNAKDRAADGEQGGYRGGISDDARAILRAHAAAELKRIPVSSAPGNGRTSYFVSEADGARMLELFGELDGVRARKYPKGITVHHDGRDWFFEYAPAGAAPTRARARQPARTGALGLPAPNVSIVEFYGFRGVQKINGIPWKDLPDAELAKVRKKFAEDQLLRYGHVGISFDGGKTIYGLTPPVDGTPALTPAQVRQMVMNHEPVPGIVKRDNDTFDRAREMAREHGWDIEITTAAALVDDDTRAATFGHTLAMSEINDDTRHGKQYQFPTEEPNEQGAYYPDDNTRNCATYPQMLGLCIPEPSGQLLDYIPELQRWADEGPIDLRAKEEEP